MASDFYKMDKKLLKEFMDALEKDIGRKLPNQRAFAMEWLKKRYKDES